MHEVEQADKRNTSPFAPLLARAKREGSPDAHFGKRNHPRFAMGATLVASTRPRDLDLAWSVVMTNISKEGMAIRSDRPVPQGSTIYINDTPAAGTEGWVQVKVMHCAPADDGYLIGLSLGDAARP